MQLSTYEQQVNNLLEDTTGYSLTKGYDKEEGEYFYRLIDQYGDIDGDPFYEFDDLVDYICNNAQVEQEIAELENLIEQAAIPSRY